VVIVRVVMIIVMIIVVIVAVIRVRTTVAMALEASCHRQERGQKDRNGQGRYR